jgi:antitoxin HicB
MKKLMLCYTIILEEDDNTLLVTSPDFPELTTFGEDHDEALVRAVDALEEAVAARIHDRRDIPMPTPGDVRVRLPTLTAVKVLLYQGMRDQNIAKAELARRLSWHLPQVDRVLNVNHHSRLDQMESALAAIGLRLAVTSVAA